MSKIQLHLVLVVDRNVLQHHVRSVVVEIEGRLIQRESERLVVKFSAAKDAGRVEDRFFLDRAHVHEHLERHALLLTLG